MGIRLILKKIVQFPLTRIVIGLVVWLVTFDLTFGILNRITKYSLLDTHVQELIDAILSVVLGIWAYRKIFTLLERRSVSELSLAGFGKNIFTGLLTGFSLLSLIMLIIYIGGGFRILYINGILYATEGLAIAIISSVGEEILFRGIIFRITEEKLGSVIALIISSALFGAVHLSNPNSSYLVALCIAIEAGLLLNAAYMYSRSLWLPIAIHFAWNFSESGIYGVPNSGIRIGDSLFTSQLDGNAMLTGGRFGPEGSVVCLIMGTVTAVLLLYLSNKQHQFVRPFWRRSMPGLVS